MKSLFFTSKQITHSVLLGMGLIVGMSLVPLMLEWSPLAITMQIATSLIAILVSSACLLHIYQEHQKGYKKERLLKKWVISKIDEMEPLLFHGKSIRSHLDQTLEMHGLQQRLKKLSRYHKNTKALKAFVSRFKRHEAAKEMLKDLGLSWDARH